MNAEPPLRICLRCGRLREHKCRNLCPSCANYLRRVNRLHEYPTTNRPGRALADTVEDYLILVRRGMSEQALAKALGYASVNSLKVTLRLARAKGLM